MTRKRIGRLRPFIYIRNRARSAHNRGSSGRLYANGPLLARARSLARDLFRTPKRLCSEIYAAAAAAPLQSAFPNGRVELQLQRTRVPGV